MKMKLFIPLLLFIVTSMTISTQIVQPEGYRSLYFDREDFVSSISGDTIVYLYEKGGKFTPERRDHGKLFGFRKMGKDILPIFKREFSDLNYPEDLLKFRRIQLSMWIDHEGNIISFYYWLKLDSLCLYPDMEKHLYNFAMSIKKGGVKKYDIYALYPNSYCELNYSFSYIYRALVLPEKNNK